ncbi:recombinase family protein [Gammaproteobacteria bacterium]|nr:recombinase family protein [Gammaproteobacteria bacterium]
MHYHLQHQFRHCRVEQGGDTAKRIIDNVTWTVSFKTYKLIYFQEKYTEKQQQLFDLVIHLKNEGMGYRKIAKYLNGMGHKTHTGKTFTPSSIQFIIKRNKERIQRKKLIETEEVLTYSNFKINFWNEEEL